MVELSAVQGVLEALEMLAALRKKVDSEGEEALRWLLDAAEAREHRRLSAASLKVVLGRENVAVIPALLLLPAWLSSW